MILPIYLEPQRILRQKTQEINIEDIKTDEFQQILFNMCETMRSADGIGLAAVQVGMNKRFTVIDFKTLCARIDSNEFNHDNFDHGVLTLINPKITKKTWKKSVMEEGCLSIPGVYGTVKRPVRISVNYLDHCGDKQTLHSDGLLARVIQHEIDHLNGILFTDKVLQYTVDTHVIPKYPHVV